MALLPYRNSQNLYHRSRSSSCSSPVKKEIFYQAVYSVGPNTLMRSYSCSQILNTDKTGQTYQTTQVRVMDFIASKAKVCLNGDATREKTNWDSDNFHKNNVSNMDQNGQTYQTAQVRVMDFIAPKAKVCLNGDATREKINWDSDNFYKNNVSDVDQKIAKSKKNRKKLMNNKRNFLKKSFKYGVLSILIGISAYFYFLIRECHHVWNLQLTSEKLTENVFGQSDAIIKVNSVLSMFNNSNDIHVMVFTGGVGVGKTFTSSIISQHFPWRSNKLITKLTGSEKTELIPNTISKCGCHLIIIDDLSVNSIAPAINLISLVKTKWKHEKVLMILIFTIHTDDEKKQIFSGFKNAYIDYFHIPFKDLSRDAVEKCFLAEILKQEVDISESELNQLIKNQMRNIDIVKGQVGCKGIAEEVVFHAERH